MFNSISEIDNDVFVHLSHLRKLVKELEDADSLESSELCELLSAIDAVERAVRKGAGWEKELKQMMLLLSALDKAWPMFEQLMRLWSE